MNSKKSLSTQTNKNEEQIESSSSFPTKGAVVYLPLSTEDLKPILSCSAKSEKGDEALRHFQKVRCEADVWRKNKYDPQEDRWLSRLRRYLKFFHGRKTASGWPITPFKFIIWAKHDPRPTMRSIRTYLYTIEAARSTTQSLFIEEFPNLANHTNKLQENPDIIKFMKEFEISLPTLSVVKNCDKTLNQTNHSTSDHTKTLETSTQPLKHINSKKKDENKSRKKRKVSSISAGSLENPQSISAKPRRQDEIDAKPSQKNRKIGHKQTTHSPHASCDLKDPFLKTIHRFDDLKNQHTQDAFLNSFRRYHPNVKSTKEEIEQLSEEIEDLTGQNGELSQIASKEELTICLESYLEFWTNKQISGFPIQAIKLCIWFDSIQVNRKEAIDIAIGFERLGKRVEDQIDDHQPILFEAPGPLAQSKLWISFLDHFGWRANQVQPNYSNNDPHNAIQEQEKSSLIPRLTEPVLEHRQRSTSSTDSSLSSLPHSTSPLLPRQENSLESEYIPDANSDKTSLNPHQASLGPYHQEGGEQREERREEQEERSEVKEEEREEKEEGRETKTENYGTEGHLGGEGYDVELTRFGFKKAQVKSPQHEQFLFNLRQFIKLF